MVRHLAELSDVLQELVGSDFPPYVGPRGLHQGVRQVQRPQHHLGAARLETLADASDDLVDPAWAPHGKRVASYGGRGTVYILLFVVDGASCRFMRPCQDSRRQGSQESVGAPGLCLKARASRGGMSKRARVPSRTRARKGPTLVQSQQRRGYRKTDVVRLR